MHPALAALVILNDASQKFALGESREGSSKMWEAVAYAVGVVAEQRGLPHADKDEMLATVQKLAEEHNDRGLVTGFLASEIFLDNAVHDFIEDDDQDFHCLVAREFIARMLELAESTASLQ